MKIKNILISQNTPSDFERSPYAELKKKYSINLDFYKFFKIQDVPVTDFRKTRINILDHEAIVFSSRNTIDHFFSLCGELRIKMPEEMKYLCLTETVAFYLQKYIQYRKRKIFVAKNATNEKFHELIQKYKNLKMLIPCGQDGIPASLENFLHEKKIQYDPAVVFVITPADLTADVKIDQYDLIVFFSPNGLKSLMFNFPNFKQGETAFAALGKTTKEALEADGFTVQVNAPTEEHSSITDAIEAFLKEHATRRR